MIILMIFLVKIFGMFFSFFGLIIWLPITKSIDNQKGDSDNEHNNNDLQFIAQIKLVMMFLDMRAMVRRH